MLLRYSADWRTLLFMAFTTGLLVFNWTREEPLWWAVGLACFMAVTVTTIAHNHNHLQIWNHKILNVLQDYWLTVFYGFPVFAWIPTHNKNHHKYNNREGDYTITYRVSEKNNLLTLLSYPTISSYYQQSPIRQYLATMWRKRKSRFWYCLSQYLVLALWIGAALLIDWKKALLYVVLPQQVGLFSVLVFNYLQHVHADEESEWNHSRNIVGPVMNLFLFNNGYHTIHHIKPGIHWSEAPEKHKEIEHNIHPSLNEPSILWLVFRVYVLGLFVKRFRTDSMRLARMEHEAKVTGGPMPEAAAAE
jgi:fatty acid desaturase